MTDLAARQSLSAKVDGDAIIDVDHVTLRFGGVTGLADVELNQLRGELLSVIGPNGAGKTSLFNCVTGVYKPQEGLITFTGADHKSHEIIGHKPHTVNHFGIARHVPDEPSVQRVDDV